MSKIKQFEVEYEQGDLVCLVADEEGNSFMVTGYLIQGKNVEYEISKGGNVLYVRDIELEPYENE